MKKVIIVIILLVLFSTQLITSCKKNEYIHVQNLTLDSLRHTNYNNLNYYGSFNVDGSNELIESVGVCWSATNHLPTINDSKIGDKYENCVDCLEGTIEEIGFEDIYYFRAYAITSLDVIYSNVVQYNPGETWKLFNTPYDATFGDDMRTISFLDPNTGWIGGNYELFRTTNAGASWEIGPYDAWGTTIKKILYINESTIYLNTFYELKKTTDGGSTWSTVHPCGYGSFPYAFNSDFVCIGNSDFNYSVDGGITWSIGNVGIPSSASIVDIHFVTESNGFFISANGYVFKTTNGGANWEIQNSSSNSIFDIDGHKVIYAFNSNELIVGSENGLYKSSDAGNTWDLVFEQTEGELVKAIDFVNNEVGICSFENIIVRTENGGLTWDKENTPSIGLEDHFFDVKLFTPNSAVAGFSSGIIIYD